MESESVEILSISGHLVELHVIENGRPRAVAAPRTII